MRATLALLLDEAIHNAMRRISVDAHRRYEMGFVGAQLPPHVSLKQPFRIADLASIEAYFDAFAATVSPLALALTQLDVQVQTHDQEEHVVLWVDVAETEQLRALHQRLNAELASRFGDTAASFDGAAYRFHVTVALAALPAGTHRLLLTEARMDAAEPWPAGTTIVVQEVWRGRPGRAGTARARLTERRSACTMVPVRSLDMPENRDKDVWWLDATTLAVHDVSTADQRTIDGVDLLVIAAGAVPANELARAVAVQAPDIALYVVGDACAPRTVEEATYQGGRVGRLI